MTEQQTPTQPDVIPAPPENGTSGQQHPDARGLEAVQSLFRESLGIKPADEGAEGEGDNQGDENVSLGNINDDPELDLAEPDESQSPAETAGAGDPITEVLGLAESAGMDAEALYKLKVPLGDEHDPVTLGALKDAYQSDQRIESKRLELEEERSDFQNEMIRSRGELAELIRLLGPDKIPPELIAHAQRAHIQQLDEQRSELLAIFPEWRDPSAFQSGQDEILAAVADYGFRRADLDSVVDHRLTKLLHDFARMKRRVDKATAKAKELKKRGGTKRAQGKAPSDHDQRRSREQQQQAARESRDSEVKISAISDLLRQQ